MDEQRYIHRVNWGLIMMVVSLLILLIGKSFDGKLEGGRDGEVIMGGSMNGSMVTGVKTAAFPSYGDQSADNRITVAVTGDVMLGRLVFRNMKKSKDWIYPFRRVGGVLRVADLTLINLENPLIDPCPERDGGMVFCAPTEVVAGLLFAGVDVANLANNHINNYGKEGVVATKNILKENNIEVSDSETVAIISRDGVLFGFIGFNLLIPETDMKKVVSAVAEAKKTVDVLIVSCHWGAEYNHDPGTEQRGQAQKIVEAGADVIVGTHPHVLQSVEVINGALVIYSLGNFVFDQNWSIDTREGVLGRLVFKAGKLESYDFLPILISKDYQPAVATDSASITKMNGYINAKGW